MISKKLIYDIMLLLPYIGVFVIPVIGLIVMVKIGIDIGMGVVIISYIGLFPFLLNSIRKGALGW